MKIYCESIGIKNEWKIFIFDRWVSFSKWINILGNGVWKVIKKFIVFLVLFTQDLTVDWYLIDEYTFWIVFSYGAVKQV
jgi:hypothetical protein